MDMKTPSDNAARRDGRLAVKAYRMARQLHTALPYLFSRGGYAFPAWHFYLEVTRRCNLRCVMCQYTEWFKTTPAPEQRAGELTTDEWRAVIEQVPRLGLITFTGGEPLVRGDFLQLLERACARSRTHFITNGTLLTEAVARRCVELAPQKPGQRGLDFVGLSLDGPEDVHDRIRGLAGAFGKSTAGIHWLTEFRRQAGKRCPMVHMTTVIQDANLEALAEMPRVAAAHGADVLNLALETRSLDPAGVGVAPPERFAATDIRGPHLDPARLRQALKDTRAAARRAGLELRTPQMPDEEIVRYYSGEMDLTRFRCGAIWTDVIVGSRGDVHACWLRKVGNVREQSLKALWNGPEFRAFRRRTRQGLYAPCSGCCSLAYRR